MVVATVNLSRDWRTIEARLMEVIEVYLQQSGSSAKP